MNDLVGWSASPVAAEFGSNAVTMPAGAGRTIRFIGNAAYSPPPTLTKEKPK